MEDMSIAQPGILQPVPVVARYALFHPADGAVREPLSEALRRLAEVANGEDVVVGIGPSLVAALGATVPGLREFPELSGHGAHVPSTPVPLWCWLRGEDRGDLLHLTR